MISTRLFCFCKDAVISCDQTLYVRRCVKLKSLGNSEWRLIPSGYCALHLGLNWTLVAARVKVDYKYRYDNYMSLLTLSLELDLIR